MRIEEVKNCPNCSSKMNRSDDYYLCNICQSYFSKKDIEDILQDKRIVHY